MRTTYHPPIDGQIIIRVFDVLHLKRCMEGSVGHLFFKLKLEKLGRLDQNWYKRQLIRVEVGDKVILEVSSWKDVVHFGKKDMLAPRYEYWTDVNMHVPLEEIKVHKTLRLIEEPVEIIDREVKSLKRSSISIVKVCWDSTRVTIEMSDVYACVAELVYVDNYVLDYYGKYVIMEVN
ncbi:hypothetical protein Tco_1102904 [Tanacetum coccineum]